MRESYGQERAAALEQRGGPRPFALPGAEDHFAPDHPFQVLHTRIALRVDLGARRIDGTVGHRVSSRRAALDGLMLHAEDLQVTAVRVDGRGVPFTHRGGQLFIPFDPPLAEGAESLVEVDYGGAPEKGLYFVHPTDEEPDKPLQAWTQGQDEDSRFWFPCFDDPSMKQPTEVVAEVPEGMIALSNGRLVEEAPAGPGWRRFHHRFDSPQPAYLVALVVGQFDVVEERHRDVALRYFFPVGEQAKARNTFACTPPAMAFFEGLLGVPYAWSKYDQVILRDFIFGGMENTTLTTLYDQTFHDDRAHLDFHSEPLVSHEMAHQWFGDLLTCRSWPHAWLNESWATYLESLHQGHAFGADEGRYYLLETFEAYLDEDASRYRRPLVQRRYRAPIEVFDRHLYEKGACILHMLCEELGAEPFWKGVRLYLERHRGGTVESEDFRRALEDATGVGLERFFHQWVYREGHASLKVTWEHDPKSGLVRVRVEQKEVDRPEDARNLTVSVRVFGKEGQRDHDLALSRPVQDFFLPSPDGAPVAVSFGATRWAVAEYEVEQAPDAWREVLGRDGDPLARIAAAAALGKQAERASVEALAAALASDGFWGVRARVCGALGKAGGDAARDALLEALIGDPHPRARRAAARALPRWRGDARVQGGVCDALRAGDASYFVEAELAETVGKVGGERAFDTLVDAAGRESHNEVIRRGAFVGLAELRDARGLPAILPWTRRGRPTLARVGAAQALARLGPYLRDRVDRDGARERIEDMLSDPGWTVRRAAIAALRLFGEPAAIPALERMRACRDGRLQMLAEEAVADLKASRDRPAVLDDLRRDLDTLREENRKLRERVEKVEAKG